jgi:hypothetical protein
MIGAMNDQNSLSGGTATTPVTSSASMITRNANLQVQLAVSGGPGQYEIASQIPGLYGDTQGNGAVQTAISGLLQSQANVAQQMIVDVANKDASASNLASITTVPQAVGYLITQMNNSSDSVNASAPSIGAQTAVIGITPTGNGIAVVTAKAGNGYLQEYLEPDTLTFQCTTDSFTGGATAGSEQITVTGLPASPSPTDYRRFLGTYYGQGMASTTLQAVDGTISNSAGGLNVLQNSDFFIATNTNVPDNWIVSAGNVGTQILQGTGGANSSSYTGSGNYGYNGGYLEFAGDGSTTTTIYQAFNTTPSATLGAGGTAYNISGFPDVPHAVNFWLKMSSNATAAGVLQVALTNSGGTVITDDQSNNNSFTVTLSGIVDTNWHNYNGVFRLPKNPPAVVWLQLKLTTALTNAKNAFLGRMAMTPMTPCLGGSTPYYNGGSLMSFFSGNNKMNATGGPLIADAWTVGITNTLGKFQQGFEQFFSMKANNLHVPSSGSSTISDALVA